MNEPQTLGTLVLKARQERDASGRRLAELASRAGHKVTHTTLNHLAAGTYKYEPAAETIRAIAWLAGVSDEVAFAAAGVPMPGPPFADELPPGVDNLTPRSRRAAIEVLRALVEAEAREDGGGDDRDAAPNMRAGGRPAPELAPGVPLPAEPFDPSTVDVDLAAREGEPDQAPDATTGEESQDPDDHHRRS